MMNLDLEKLGLRELTEEEMITIEGGSIFTKAWDGIKNAAEAVADFVVDKIVAPVVKCVVNKVADDMMNMPS
ncbi:hypothetical protein [Dysgonomonas sp. 25]|uniref:hypothetical protein n=1 Tax=Dysgonomonas sp. 25 TaxID=2302933 RepID=UPI0013D2B5FB|nr:hypothetical protein [Dysgonomonas sp. 25]NDV68609.1 hypothetical protein [Dysgonomonas sp. 25]